MTLVDSRTRLAFVIAAVVALASSPFLAVWWIAAGVVLGIVGAAMIPTTLHRNAKIVLSTGIGLAVGGLLYVLGGLLLNAL